MFIDSLIFISLVNLLRFIPYRPIMCRTNVILAYYLQHIGLYCLRAANECTLYEYNLFVSLHELWRSGFHVSFNRFWCSIDLTDFWRVQRVQLVSMTTRVPLHSSNCWSRRLRRFNLSQIHSGCNSLLAVIAVHFVSSYINSPATCCVSLAIEVTCRRIYYRQDSGGVIARCSGVRGGGVRLFRVKRFRQARKRRQGILFSSLMLPTPPRPHKSSQRFYASLWPVPPRISEYGIGGLASPRVLQWLRQWYGAWLRKTVSNWNKTAGLLLAYMSAGYYAGRL